MHIGWLHDLFNKTVLCIECNLIEWFFGKVKIIGESFHDLKNSPKITWALFASFSPHLAAMKCQQNLDSLKKQSIYLNKLFWCKQNEWNCTMNSSFKQTGDFS